MDEPLNKIKLDFTVLPNATKKALDFLSTQEWLKSTDWYLAGGTALALQTGNRQSVDLDFFIRQVQFDSIELLDRLSSGDDFQVELSKDNTIFAILCGAKVSFIAYPFFFPQQEFLWYGSVRILNKVDIAVMKIIAISQRGKKRDFFDLYWCAKNIESLEDIILRLKIQYPSVAHNYHHILKSLMYFEDAEMDPEPEIFFQATWPEVKRFFQTEIPRLTKKLIGLD